jgi:class 3 adenylate cyclase
VPAHSERKLATVLFADLVDSTAAAGDQDPERTRTRLERFYDAMTAEIEGAGGTVEKFAGDAVMAAFGAPEAVEDHAERALHASLAVALVPPFDEYQLQTWFALPIAAVRLDALAAARDRDRLEREAPRFMRPGMYMEPFALRALGIVREDDDLIRLALDRFEVMRLDWHAAQTRVLL